MLSYLISAVVIVIFVFGLFLVGVILKDFIKHKEKEVLLLLWLYLTLMTILAFVWIG